MRGATEEMRARAAVSMHAGWRRSNDAGPGRSPGAGELASESGQTTGCGVERIRWALQLSLTLLVGLAGLVFGLAEDRTIVPFLTIPCGIATFLLVDRGSAWQTPALFHNLLALTAFGLAGLEFLMSDVEAPLLAGGHLLTYLTLVHLLQEKGRRQVWWLAALSLLQVAVGSLLTYNSWYGLAMLAFLLLMLWTLGLFQLHSTLSRAEEAAAPGRDEETSDTGRAGERGWLGPSRTAMAAQFQDQLVGLTGAFLRISLAGTILSALLAGVFFLLIPRVWTEATPYYLGGRAIGGAPSRTGFSTQVSLGHVGTVQESSRVALESRLFDKRSGTPVDWEEWQAAMGGAVRFRGAVQEIYEDGTWRRWEGAEASLRPLNSIFPVAAGTHRQELQVFHESQPGVPDVVFTAGFVTRASTPGKAHRLEIEPTGWTLLSAHDDFSEPRSQGGRQAGTTYELDVAHLDPPFPNRLGANIPGLRMGRTFHAYYLNAAMSMPHELLVELQDWIRAHPELSHAGGSHHELARNWENWFINTPEFRYSLNLSVQDPHLDPLLDFLSNTRRGHCEYFASALAMLLRTQGIPTRVVSGYKGGHVEADGRLVVRDLHAHLWVEAYIEDAPEDPVTGQFGPRWITLDPTPAARDEFVMAQEQQSGTWWSQLSHQWTATWNYSIRMNQSDQQQLVYVPLRDGALEVWETIKNSFIERRPWELLRPLASPREWFSWSGGVTAFVLLLALSGLVAAIRRGWAWMASRRVSVAAADQARVIVPFYERLQQVLARYGATREPADTPREFARHLVPDGALPLPAELESGARELTERFYAVRFGGEALSDAESAQLDSRIAAWEAASPLPNHRDHGATRRRT